MPSVEFAPALTRHVPCPRQEVRAETLASALDAAFTRAFDRDTPPAAGTATRLPGQVVYGGLDLGPVTTFYLTVDLKAGTEATLQTWFYDADGHELSGAYFADVRRE